MGKIVLTRKADFVYILQGTFSLHIHGAASLQLRRFHNSMLILGIILYICISSSSTCVFIVHSYLAYFPKVGLGVLHALCVSAISTFEFLSQSL